MRQSKLETGWRGKSIERLEKSEWQHSGFESSTVDRGLQLRKIPLGELKPDDLRFLLVQQIGLPYVLELSLELLSRDLLIEAEYYPGDTLHAMLILPAESRKANRFYFEALQELIAPRMDELRAIRPRLPLDDIS